MRMSTAGMHRTSIDAILEHQYQMAKTQQQITTGKKFQTAAEDPIGATRAAVLDRTMADNAQYGRNSNIIESRLNYEEQSLADATSLLQAARDLALGGANSTLGPEERKNYGPPVLAGTYSLKTLVDIGLAPKETIDKLGYRHYDRLESQRRA